MPGLVSLEEFIRRSREHHGDKYDYSKVNFVKIDDKVIIGCPFHGEIEQSARSHSRGNGCHRCSNDTKKLTTETFIQKAKLIHGDKYDYSLVEYKSSKDKITIICPDHGVFEQTPGCHFKGTGCSTCGWRSLTKGFVTWEAFLEKATIIHGSKYEYIKPADWKGHQTYIEIKCHIHGVFKQCANLHTAGRGCTPCGYIKASKLNRESKEITTNMRELVCQYISDLNQTKNLFVVNHDFNYMYKSEDYYRRLVIVTKLRTFNKIYQNKEDIILLISQKENKFQINKKIVTEEGKHNLTEQIVSYNDINCILENLLSYLPYGKIVNVTHDVQDISQEYIDLQKVGIETEQFVLKIINNFPDIEYTELVGRYYNQTTDIMYKLKIDEKERSIQVKTLKQVDVFNRYRYDNDCRYDYNMLMVAINKERTRFFCGYYMTLSELFKGGEINFDKNYDNPNICVTTDVEEFKKKLSIMMIHSTEYTFKCGPSALLEYESTVRFINFLTQYNIPVKVPDNVISLHDIEIFQYKCQLKFNSYIGKSFHVGNTFRMNTYKSRQGIRIPYTYQDNIDLFIFEHSSMIGKFFIIPMNYLVKIGTISSRFVRGKVSVMIDPGQKRWSRFINNLSPFDEVLIDGVPRTLPLFMRKDIIENKCYDY